jgi:RimJ/RimL family protein N-acetyltransferase
VVCRDFCNIVYGAVPIFHRYIIVGQMNDGSDDDKKITWRFASLSDADILLQWRNEPDTFLFTKKARPLKRAEHHEWVVRQIAKSRSDSVLLIFSFASDQIGMSRLDRLNGFDFEISISVGKMYQGKGYGKIILEMSIKYALETLSAERVIATIHCENTKSQKLFQYAGFKPVREILNRGNFRTFWLGK